MFQRQLAIIRQKNQFISAVFDGRDLDDVIVDEAGDLALRVGDIYIGKVSHIVRNIHAAFVEVQKDCMCYVPLSEAGGGRIVQGQEMPVQIKKAAVKSKRAVASCKLQFAGKYAVVTNDSEEKSITSKITDETVRARLEQILEPLREIPFGIILRTGCQHASDASIQEECARLVREAEQVASKSKTRIRFSRLYRSDMEVVKYLRSTPKGRFDRIITDEREIYEMLGETGEFADENIVFYEDESYPLEKLLGIGDKLEKALMRHVWLKSGASLVIDPTEALTVIDVNTQKAIEGKRSSETTFFQINREAAREAARQIRIRNISGIILIDFIDMKDREHIQVLLRELESEFEKDSVKTNVVDITKLGLVEITRMKVRKPLREFMHR